MITTFERLGAILSKEFKLAPERLAPDTPLEELGIDSLGTVELLWHVEEAFAIKLPPEPVDLATLADVVVFIDALVARQRGAAAPRADAAAALAPQSP